MTNGMKKLPDINPLVQQAYNKKANAMVDFAKDHSDETSGIVIAILPIETSDGKCVAAQASLMINACHHRVAALGKSIAEALKAEPHMLAAFVVSFLDVVAEHQSAEVEQMRHYSDKVH